jgi:hypothetical protein
MAMVPAMLKLPDITYDIKNVAELPVMRQLKVFTRLRRAVSLIRISLNPCFF